MAILNSLINTGVSRLLGKVYMNDLDIGSNLIVQGKIETEGSINIGKNTAANALIYLNNKLAIQGKDGWLRINEKVNGVQPFASGVYYGNSIVRSDNGFQIGNAGDKVVLSSSAATFKVPTTITSTLNVNGETTFNQANITTANIGTANMQNANVYDTLRAAKYSIETVQNLGGHFLVCPTIEVPSTGNESSFSCQVTRPSATSDKLTIAFTDNSLSTDTFAGTTWTANSKVKVTGMINNVALGTCDGTIISWNKSSKVVTVSITCGTEVSSRFSTSVTTYTSAQVSNLSIMMYEVYTNNTTYPIGIYITSYGKNKYSYIDIYGGTSDKPTTRMGKLDGLDKVNNTSPTGWGFYSAQNGYFQGTIVSSAGKIGGFTIGSNAIYSSANALGTTANNVYIGTEGISLGTTFKVTKAGALTATSGKIANWRIEGTYLATGTATAPAKNVLILSPNGTTSSYSVAGQNKTGWMITAGTTFGVNKDGGVYATSGKIGGWTVDATKIYSGTHSTWNSTAEDGLYLGNDGIAGGSGGIWCLWKDGSAKIGAMTLSAAGVLSVPAANITGTLSADRIGANTLTIGKFVTADQDKILNEKIEVGGRNLVLNSRNFFSFKNESTNAMTVTTNADYTIITRLNTSANSHYGIYYDIDTVNTDSDYTISFTVSGTVDNYFYLSIGHLLPSTGPSKWTGCVGYTRIVEDGRYTLTFNTKTATSIRMYLSMTYIDGKTNVVQISDIKLEKGNKATDWTPAPEDIDDRIDGVAEDAANANEALNEDIYGEPFYQYTTGGVTYDVWKAEDGKYYYDDGSETGKEVAASALDQDSDGYIIVRHGGLQDSVEKIAGSVLVDSAEPSVTIQAKHTEGADERTAGIKITDERVSFKKNGEEVAYIDSSEDEGVIDINNARIHVTLRIGQLEIFDHDGGIGIRRYDD